MRSSSRLSTAGRVGAPPVPGSPPLESAPPLAAPPEASPPVPLPPVAPPLAWPPVADVTPPEPAGEVPPVVAAPPLPSLGLPPLPPGGVGVPQAPVQRRAADRASFLEACTAQSLEADHSRVEQRQVNGLAHGLIAHVAGVQIVAVRTFVLAGHVVRVTRVANCDVEVDALVVVATRPNPGVQLIPLRVACVHGRNRRDEHLDACGLSLHRSEEHTS